MHRVLFEIPLRFSLWGHQIDGIPIYSFGAMLCIGFLLATCAAAWRAKHEGHDSQVIFNCALLAFLGGIVGSRAFYVIQHGDESTTFWQVINIRAGGLTYFGGLLLAAALIIWYLHKKRLNVLEWSDIIAPSLALGLAFGRIGCFLNGCCWGAPSNLPWAFSWPEGTLPHDAYLSDWHLAYPGQAVPPDWAMPAIHPSQLYAVLNAILIFVVLSFVFRLKRRHGQILGLFFALYSGSRLLLEFLRSDEARVYLFGIPTLFERLGHSELVQNLPRLTISQNVSVLVFIGAMVFLRIISRSHHPALLVKEIPLAAKKQ